MIDILSAPKTGMISRFSGITILPYLANALPFSGMEKHRMVLHDGVWQEDIVINTIESGIQTYITGLNEEGPEVTSIADKDRRAAKIKEIRRFIAKCEQSLAGNHACSENDIDDKQKFYANVKTFRSVFPAEYAEDQNGIKRLVPRYWDKLSIQLRNEGYTLNTTKIEDRLKQYILEAGGYGMVAPSLQVAKDSGQYSFYVDKVEETSKDEAQELVDRDEAGAKLYDMYKKNTDKLFYITKLISAYPLQWRAGINATSSHLMYKECTNYLNGEGIEKRKKDAIKRFIDLEQTHIDDLKIQCYVNDGFRMGKLSIATDGTITHTPTGTVLGKGVGNVIAFLKAGGEAEPIYIALSKECEAEWKSE